MASQDRQDPGRGGLTEPGAPASAGWRSAAVTKFHAPRLRREVVARPALLERARQMAMDRRLLLVQAPAGSGKSILLSQLAQALAATPEVDVVWVSLDTDDSDANRLFASVLGGLHTIELDWDLDPQTLAGQVQGDSPQSRAALTILINALSSFAGERLVLILDDLHRVTDADALRLLDDLVERMPPEIGLVIGSRLAPALSLPRWRARGELGELLTADLQFDEQDAGLLASQHLADGDKAEAVRQALARTGGWAAGLRLVFGAGGLKPALTASSGMADTATARIANRHLFDFFAHEVLAELPEPLREFTLQCAVLPELRPRLCRAVTGRADAHQLLDELYRRNLFLTVLDDTTPVLRFHDLFLDFLRAELDRQHPGLAPSLHARAAEAEVISPRAVSHWLHAQRWQEAVQLIHQCAPALLAEGGQGLVEKWMRQLPAEEARQYPEVAHLLGVCAWARYDYLHTLAHLEQACQGYLAQGRHDEHARALILLAWISIYVGDIEHGDALLTQAEGLPLPPEHAITATAARAWHAVASGRFEQAAQYLTRLADTLEADATWLFPAVSDLFNGIFYGLPGTLAPLRRLRNLCARHMSQQAVHWQVGALATSPWPEFWAGDLAGAALMVERHQAFHDKWSLMQGLMLNAGQVKGWFAAAQNQPLPGPSPHALSLQAIDAGPLSAMTRSWRRVVVLNMARDFWISQDADSLRALLPDLQDERKPEEWPCVQVALHQVRGQLACLAGDLTQAQVHLRQAVATHGQHGLPGFFGDPRISLAIACLAQHDEAQAWQAFEPCWQQSLHEDSVGAWLVEPPGLMQQVLNLVPPEALSQPRVRSLIERYRQWQSITSASTEATPPRTAITLSDRERDVLARIAAGHSNKLIARDLDLSPHTVKRHVANILAKIDCATRGQAAAWWRAQTR